MLLKSSEVLREQTRREKIISSFHQRIAMCALVGLSLTTSCTQSTSTTSEIQHYYDASTASSQSATKAASSLLNQEVNVFCLPKSEMPEDLEGFTLDSPDTKNDMFLLQKHCENLIAGTPVVDNTPKIPQIENFSRNINTVEIVLHEFAHLGGVEDEAEAECQAIQQLSGILNKLGYHDERLVREAVAWRVFGNSLRPDEYRLDSSCPIPSTLGSDFVGAGGFTVTIDTGNGEIIDSHFPSSDN